jgi:pyruvate kinase
VFAFTPSDEVRRQLSICWGVCAQRIEFSDDPNETIETAAQFLKDRKLASRGDNLVVISDVKARGEAVDCVQLRSVK